MVGSTGAQLGGQGGRGVGRLQGGGVGGVCSRKRVTAGRGGGLPSVTKS